MSVPHLVIVDGAPILRSGRITLGPAHISPAALAPGAAPPLTEIDLQVLLAGRLLVQANSGAGKSWLLRRLLEEAYGLVQQVVIDPDGEFTTLADRFDYAVLPYAEIARVGAAGVAGHIRQHGYSAVLDLSECGDEERMLVVAEFASALVEQDANRPLIVALDEAQVVVPHYDPGDVDRAIRRRATAALADVMGRGRKRGLCGVIVTQRLAETAKAVCAKATNVIVGRTIFDRDLVRAGELLGFTAKKASGLRNLGDGEFLAIGPAFGPRRIRFRTGPTKTEHRGKTPELGIAAAIGSREAKAMLAALPDAAPSVEPAPTREPRPLRQQRALRSDGWTEAEDEIITAGYAGKSSGLEIVHALNAAGFERGVGAIQGRAYKLGLTTPRPSVWSDEEKAIVRAGYAAKKGRHEILADLSAAGFTNRTSCGIGWIAGEIGLYQAPKPWTEGELEILRQRYAEGVKPREIAKELMRNYGGIVTKANSLGLRLYKEWTNAERQRLAQAAERGETLVSVAAELGRPYTNVAQVAKKMGVSFRRPPGPTYHSGAPVGTSPPPEESRESGMSPEAILAARGRSVVRIGGDRWLVDGVKSYDAEGLAELAARGAR